MIKTVSTFSKPCFGKTEKLNSTFLDRNGNITTQVIGETWEDADGDTRISFGDSGYSMAFTKPTSDYGAGASYPPAGFGGGRESYQPTRGGGLSSGEFSDRRSTSDVETFSARSCGPVRYACACVRQF